MKQYKEYKDSGIAWVGAIPSHWQVKRLREFIEIYSDKEYPSETLLSVVRDKGVIVRDIDSKEENHNFIPGDLSGYKRIKQGDFVINKMKAWQGSYAVSEYQGIVSPAYYTCKLRCSNKEFFNLAIRSKAYIPFFTQYSKGIRVGQWDLSPIGLKDIPFFLPPEAEQEAIVKYLDKKTEQINQYIRLQEQQIQGLQELKQSIIARAVTRGLDPKAPLRPSGIAWIGDIPCHWQVERIKPLLEKIESGVWGNEAKENETDTICFRVADFNYDKGNLSFKSLTYRNIPDNQLQTKLLKQGDLLLEKSGGGELSPVGRVVRVNTDKKATCSNFIQILRTKKSKVDSSFLYYFFFTLYSKRINTLYFNHTTGIQNLKVSDYLSQSIPLPPEAEQEAIVKYLDKKTEQINLLISKTEASIALMKEFKQSLIADAVTGRINVQPA